MGDQQPSLFEGEKKCRICKKRKSIDQFMLYDSRGKTYRKNLCLDCERKWQRDHSKKAHVRERNRLTQKRYRENDRAAYNARSRKWKAAKRDEHRLLIHEAYGGKCACCGETEPLFLTVDHINNDGYVERRQARYTSGSQFYAQIVKENFPPRYQLLCYNCNHGKARNGGVCPHQKGSETIPQGSTAKRPEAPATHNNG